MNPDTVPLVLEYNKRDIPKVSSIPQLDKELNRRKVPSFETCALDGKGIFEALRTITKLVLSDLKRKGIYKGTKSKSAQAGSPKESKVSASAKRAPVVNPSVEESLVQALENRMEEDKASGLKPQDEDKMKPTPVPVESRGLTFSELWSPGPTRDQILAMEADIERSNHEAAIRRAEGLLHEYLGEASGMDTSAGEALLMLGVYGPHYERFKHIVSKKEPLKQDAIYCLFFLADIHMRIHMHT